MFGAGRACSAHGDVKSCRSFYGQRCVPTGLTPSNSAWKFANGLKLERSTVDLPLPMAEVTLCKRSLCREENS